MSHNLHSADRTQTTRSRLSGIEHHILVLLIGAAFGSYATIQEMSHNDAKTRAAAHHALKAALRPPQSQPSQREPATPAVQPAAAPTTQMTRFGPFSEIIGRELER